MNKKMEILEGGILTRTIFEYCKIKKISLDEFIEQVKNINQKEGE